MVREMKLSFNLNTQDDVKIYLKAKDLYHGIDDIQNEIRSFHKYDSKTHGQNAEEVLEWVREELLRLKGEAE